MNDENGSVSGLHIMTGFTLCLLIYTGWRASDFVYLELTGVNETLRRILSFVVLGASEIGLLLWLHVGGPKSTTQAQATTAAFMTWFNFAGSMLLGLGDVLRHNTTYAVDLSWLDPVLLFGPWVLIGVNVGAYLIYFASDSTTILSRKKQALIHARTQGELTILTEAVKIARTEAHDLAREIAPDVAAAWLEEMRGNVSAQFIRKAKRRAPKMRDRITDLIPGAGDPVPALADGKGNGNGGQPSPKGK